MRSLLTKILLFCVLFYAVERFCHRQTEGFQLHKILSESDYNPKWETKSISIYPTDAFDQPYRFLGSGGQCYAFVSQDKKYVIKFFKQHHMRKIPWLEKAPLPGVLNTLRKKILYDREKRSKERIFGSYQIAYNEMEAETGLIALHLNKSSHLQKTLTIIDKIGIAHQIDLDTTEFALQHYARPFYSHLNSLYKRKQLTALKESLSSFAHLIKERERKGIADLDLIIKKNFGYIGNKAVEIDLGSFVWEDQVQNPTKVERAQLLELLRLKKWLVKRQPELLDYLNAELESHFGPH